MKQTTQQWSFEPLSHTIPAIFVDSKSDAAIVFCVAFFLLWLGDTYSKTAKRLMLCLCLFGIIWFVQRKWRLWKWYRRNHEYIRLDDEDLHFCIYPHSGSLKYREIMQVAHWYEERIDQSEYIYDEDIGIVLTTMQGELKLNLERMIQSDDSISFCTNSGVVLNELSKRIKVFQAA